MNVSDNGVSGRTTVAITTMAKEFIMIRELRANLWLVGLTCLMCAVIYPAIVLGIGSLLFSQTARGDLLRNTSGTVIGSKAIAQPFAGDQYFHSRPSAVAYNAAASGASNWGANNCLLRDRVARLLGPVVKTQSGELVGPDIERWFAQDRFQQQPGIVAQWAQAHPTLAANWLNESPLHGEFVATWWREHPDEPAAAQSSPPQNEPPSPPPIAEFWISFSKHAPGKFPVVSTVRTSDGQEQTLAQPVAEGPVIQAVFFDLWRQDHPDVPLEPVPADYVMASGSGLDPHITLRNAKFQLDRVAAARSQQTGRDSIEVKTQIDEILQKHAGSPCFGMAGVPLVNVLEVNLAIDKAFSSAN